MTTQQKAGLRQKTAIIHHEIQLVLNFQFEICLPPTQLRRNQETGGAVFSLQLGFLTFSHQEKKTLHSYSH